MSQRVISSISTAEIAVAAVGIGFLLWELASHFQAGVRDAESAGQQKFEKYCQLSSSLEERIAVE